MSRTHVPTTFVSCVTAQAIFNLVIDACSRGVMQASLKRSQQPAPNFQPLKRVRTQTELNPTPMDATKAVRPSTNAHTVKKLVIKNLKGNSFSISHHPTLF